MGLPFEPITRTCSSARIATEPGAFQQKGRRCRRPEARGFQLWRPKLCAEVGANGRKPRDGHVGLQQLCLGAVSPPKLTNKGTQGTQGTISKPLKGDVSGLLRRAFLQRKATAPPHKAKKSRIAQRKTRMWFHFRGIKPEEEQIVVVLKGNL